MDTRFWGPSGWQLYHLIAESYNDKKQEKYELFFNSIKFVLPCRFCRESATKFLTELPVHPAMKSKNTLTKWLYDFHNLVNNKLRMQCKDDPKVICPPPDPSYEKVREVYNELLTNKPNAPPGLDFLFCVAYNYPSEPTTDTIQAYACTFAGLADIYPYENLRKIIKKHMRLYPLQNALKSREQLLHWWYNLAKKLCNVTGFEIGSFRGTLQKYGRIKSSCNRGKTCRNGRKIRDHTKTFKITHERLVRLPSRVKLE
jgi:hypothetical protein